MKWDRAVAGDQRPEEGSPLPSHVTHDPDAQGGGRGREDLREEVEVEVVKVLGVRGS